MAINIAWEIWKISLFMILVEVYFELSIICSWIVFVDGKATVGTYNDWLILPLSFAALCWSSMLHGFKWLQRWVFYFIWSHLITDSILACWMLGAEECHKSNMSFMGIVLGPISDTQDLQKDKFYCKLLVFMWPIFLHYILVLLFW